MVVKVFSVKNPNGSFFHLVGQNSIFSSNLYRCRSSATRATVLHNNINNNNKDVRDSSSKRGSTSMYSRNSDGAFGDLRKWNWGQYLIGGGGYHAKLYNHRGM